MDDTAKTCTVSLSVLPLKIEDSGVQHCAHHKQIDMLGDKDGDNNYIGNPDTNLRGEDYYRVYLDWTAPGGDAVISELKITDTLSEYVDWADDASVKVTRTDTSAADSVPVEIWKGANTGSAQNNIDDIASVTFENKTLTVTFKTDLNPDPNHKYVISYDIKVSDAAKTEWSDNISSHNPAGAYGGQTGDADTDYPGGIFGNITYPENETSSLQPGFPADEKAAVNMNVDGEAADELVFPHPVVQVLPNYHYDHHMRIDWLGEKDENDSYVDNNSDTDLLGDSFYRIYMDMTGKPINPTDLMIVVERSDSTNDIVSDTNKSRMQIVNEILFGAATAENGLIDDFLSGHEENKVCLITFGGLHKESNDSWGGSGDVTDYTDTYPDKDTNVVLSWTNGRNYRKPDDLTAPVEVADCSAGLICAQQEWEKPAVKDDNHNKIMIFLSDGELPSILTRTEPFMAAARRPITDSRILTVPKNHSIHSVPPAPM